MRSREESGALVRAYLENRTPLRAMLMERLGDAEEVHELMQETFLRVVETAEVGHIGNPRAYLYRIAANLAVDRIRDAQRRRRIFIADETAAEAVASSRPTPEAAAESRMRLQQMQEILGTLSPKCREAFLLSRRDGLTYQEIAKRMGVSSNMVKKHLVRALAALRAGMPPR